MEFLDPELEKYAAAHSSPASAVLEELERETSAKVLMPRMLSGHVQGRFLSMMAKMMNANRILEIGTYTGYSAICMAEGLGPEGQLHTIDINEELESMATRYFEKAGMENKISFHVGDALQIIPALQETWDLVFIDADKQNYSNYFDLVIDRLRPGGCIIADNVLWSGKVLGAATDDETQALKDFNQKVQDDDRVENILLPIRDGLMLCRKK